MSKTTQETILSVLESLVPEGDREKVNEAVNALVAELHEAYAARLEEETDKISGERKEDWDTAEKGYKQAIEIIEDLRNRLAIQKEEFDQTLEEQYAVAYGKLQDERQKNESIRDEVMADAQKKLTEMQTMMVEKVDEFLAEMHDEYYEEVRREVMNDPCLVEHRAAFEKVLDITSQYISDEDVKFNSNSKAEELSRKLEQVEANKRILESKNTSLMTENHKMQRYLKETRELIEQNMLNEQQERVATASKAQGRGDVVSEPERQVLIGETVDNRTATTNNEYREDDNEPKTLQEQWQYLANVQN